jgi:hypothetical protein
MSRNETVSGGRKRRRQDEFITSLLSHSSVEAAAAAAKIGRATAFRWLRDADILERLREARKDAWGRAMAQLQEAGPEAVEALRRTLREAESEAARVSAAKAFLEMGLRVVELNDIEDRLTRLEAIAKGRGWAGEGDGHSPTVPRGVNCHA